MQDYSLWNVVPVLLICLSDFIIVGAFYVLNRSRWFVSFQICSINSSPVVLTARSAEDEKQWIRDTVVWH